MTTEVSTGATGTEAGSDQRSLQDPEDRPRSATSNVSFEIATFDDLFAISELLLRSIPDCVPQTVDQLWEREAETWVARSCDGRVVASASLVPLPGDRWELRGVIVDPSFRGNRVGQRLVAHLLGRRSIEGDEVCCVTRHPRFFRQLGFEPLGTPWDTGSQDLGRRRRVAMHRNAARRAR